MGLILGGASASDLILNGQSVSLYVGGSPPTKVWPTRETVQITLGTGYQARDQFRAALTARGLNYQTVTEVPFEIELVGTGSVADMFSGCSALMLAPDMDTSGVTSMRSTFYSCQSLVRVPEMDTSQVTEMRYTFYNCPSLTSAPAMDTSSVTTMEAMLYNCSALTYVPDMNTSQVTNMQSMLRNCAALTDGNVRLIGKHPNVNTAGMIADSGLTREPWYTADGQPWPTAEVHEVTITNATGTGTAHPLLTVTVPAGETWDVRIQGTITKAPGTSARQPSFRIGTAESGKYRQGAAVDFSGTVTASNSTIAVVTGASFSSGTTSFTGTVTIEK